MEWHRTAILRNIVRINYICNTHHIRIGQEKIVGMNFNSILHPVYPNWVLLMLNQCIRLLVYVLVYTEV